MGQPGGYGLARQDSGGTMAVSGSGSGMSAGAGGVNGGGGVDGSVNGSGDVTAAAGNNSMKAEPVSVGRVGIVGLSYRGGGGGRGDARGEDSAAGELYGMGAAEYGGMPYGRQYKPPSPDGGDRAGADGGGGMGEGRGGGRGQHRRDSRDSRDPSQ